MNNHNTDRYLSLVAKINEIDELLDALADGVSLADYPGYMLGGVPTAHDLEMRKDNLLDDLAELPTPNRRYIARCNEAGI